MVTVSLFLSKRLDVFFDMPESPLFTEIIAISAAKIHSQSAGSALSRISF